MDKKDKVILIATALIAILGAGFLYISFEAISLRKELKETRPQLIKKDEQFARSIKNLDELRKQVEQREQYWKKLELSYRDSLAQARKKTAAATKRYEKIGNTPPPDWSDKQLDSLIRAILRPR